MKILLKYILLILFSFCFRAGFSQFVTIKGKQFYDEQGNLFFPVIMNYSISFSYNINPTAALMSANDIDVNPHLHYGSTANFEHPDGLLAIQHDFHEIHNLGFNTVRLLTGIIKRNSLNSNSPCYGQITSPSYSLDWFVHSYDQNIFNGGYNNCFSIIPPYDVAQNDHMNWFLQKINSVITVAQAETLKVILLTSDGYDLFQNQTDIDDYEDYLKVMTSYFSNNQSILAYDLINEPHFTDGDHGILFRSKHQICEFITQLYDAIKQPSIDPNHLITLGLGDEGTIFSWDPEVMKTDFVCLHLYPLPDYKYDFVNNTQFTVMQNAAVRLRNIIYWASNYINRPWVLEETGFSCSTGTNDWECYGVNGNATDLSDYLSILLPEIKNCGPSGFSWWNFQDGAPSFTTPCIYNPATYDSRQYRESYTGLLALGDPDPITGSYANLNLEKQPGADAFRNFDWYSTSSPCNSGPASATYNANDQYYNPFLHQTNSHAVYGTVVDQNNIPIAGALIAGTDWLDGTAPNTISYGHTTFTDENGYFEIIPFNYIHQTDPRLTDIRVVGMGTKRFEDGFYGSEFQINPNQGTILLEKLSLDFNENITTDVNIGDSRFFKGWNSLSASLVVDGNNISGGNADLTARNEIHLFSEFQAKKGSEVHIFTSETFPDCDDYSTYTRLARPITSVETSSEKEIDLIFSFPSQNFGLRIYPNPNTGKFTINIENPAKNPVTIFLENFLGETVWIEQTLQPNVIANFDYLPKGMYFIRLKNQNQVLTKKIIIN